MDIPDIHPEFYQGIDLFNQAEFFEAHEAWETPWEETLGQKRLNYQGFIQIAACFLQIQRGFFEGSRTLYQRALKKFEHAKPEFHGIILKTFLQEVENLINTLPADHRGPALSFPCTFPKLQLKNNMSAKPDPLPPHHSNTHTK